MSSNWIQSLLVGGLFAAPAVAYDDLPSGVVHFPLHRVSRGEEHELLKRSSDTVSAVLNNSVSYFSTVLQIGSNQENLTVQIDTGSSDLWVMDSTNPYCAGASNSNIASTDQINCTSDTMFDSAASTTFHSNNTAFNISYGDTTFASGSYGYDNVVVSGANITNAHFAVATQSNSSTIVFGIGLTGSEATVTTENDGVLTPTYANLPIQMKQQGIIEHVGYSLWLNDLDAEDGSLLFGGVDHAKYSGSLQTVPLVSDIAGVQPYAFYVVTGNLELYQGSEEGILAEMNILGLLDSGTSLIQLPTSVVEVILSATGGAYDDDEGYCLIPCDSTGGLTFNIAGIEIQVPFAEITIPVSDGTCLLEIAPNDENLILGDPFLRQLYVVYDLENLEVAMAPTVFNTTESDVEVFSSTIPSATQAPSYSATSWNTTIATNVPTFYKSGSLGSGLGEYPSGYSVASETVSGSTGSAATTTLSASAGDVTTSPEVVHTSTTKIVATSATSTGAATTSSSASTSSHSSSKNGAPREKAAAGLLLGVGSLVLMLI